MSDAAHACGLAADQAVPADAVREAAGGEVVHLTRNGTPVAPWRIRVGDFRVVYTIAEEALVVTVVRVANRREVYRGL
jgi:hypothetical protein